MLGALYLLYLIRNVIGLIAVSVFVAVALGPAVDFFQRQRLGRGQAIVATYLSLLLAIFVVGLLVVPPIVSETNKFVAHVPNYVRDLTNNKTIRKYDQRYGITKKLEQQTAKLPDTLGSAASALRDVTVGVFSAVITLVTVLVLAFFLLLDGRRIVNWLFRELGPVRGKRARAVGEDVYRTVGGYVIGNFVISLIAGLTTWMVLAVQGIQFAVPLALLMAFLDLVPLVGATIAGFVIAVVCALQDFPTAPIVFVVYLIVYQQIENNALQPLIYRRTVALHPMVVLVGVLIGAQLLGVLGALLAIPIAGAIQIVVRDWWRWRGGRSPLEGDSAIIDPTGA